MHSHDGETGLNPDLARAVASLRDLPEIDTAWVRRVADTAMQRRTIPSIARRGFHVTPLTAIAASLVCVLLGSGATALVLRARVEPSGAALAAERAGSAHVRFAIDAPAASTVAIVGDFNGWNPTSLPLRRGADGRTWVIDVPLAPGRYAYSFLVDGKLARDPAAPQARDDDFGSSNSVIMVKGS
ncbi:MAG TPA: isoamylase early set domain-containing protein [Gemmatimonadaceae bacterium]|nr:isoamylase early set domain-containing protein [Gemmatimonadaceae bacterium]